MQRQYEGATPRIADEAFVSEMAYAIGDVEVGSRSSIWPFVCLRGDGSPVTVGEETNVQEFTMLHGATLGDEVTVGHGAVVDYAEVHDHSLVGMGSAVMGGATVESNCIVAANAVVRQGQRIPEGHMAYGVPAETRPLGDEQVAQIGVTHENYVELSAKYRGTPAEANRNGD
ncbi:gamma carbonic anhydrase family protein [Halomicroarcula sp. F13]|uniref:Gamma carbonic anhydrase family protein n=1 Tax=Haloarcula rubra TaxID=2487747 RepID=A0AAW4PWM7_9EURY|nr:gamma carbonic anhydrase family protein [Halomicroarcula rubra]MBX0325443.1 gamma carbonic anhydrase family protein [Halomicroarcula rubra]